MVVNDEVVAGDLIVASAIRLGICLIIVLVEHGEPDYWRQVYQEAGSAHGATTAVSEHLPASG